MRGAAVRELSRDSSRVTAAFVLAVSNATMQSVVRGVQGDLQEGEDGELYEAMGFVSKSLRNSGLTRKRATEAAKPPNGTATS